MTVLAAAGVWLTWRVFVTTAMGQQLDNAAFELAQIDSLPLQQISLEILHVVSVPFIVIAVAATGLLAVIRRRPSLAIQAAVLVGGANLTTQVLKHQVLDRPDLGVTASMANALPSGHTTVAASVAAALVIVSHRTLRPLTALIGATYTALTGVATLIASWHRPSDAVAAVLVVLTWCGIVTAVAPPPRVPDSRGPEGRATAAAFAGMGALGIAVAIIALWRGIAALQSDGPASRTDLIIATASGATGVLVATTLSFAAILLIRRELEAAAHEDDPGDEDDHPAGA